MAQKKLDKLIIETSQPGDGILPQRGQQVTVHYTGRLISNGSVFDSSVKKNRPFKVIA